jgi:hypothetical protein
LTVTSTEPVSPALNVMVPDAPNDRAIVAFAQSSGLSVKIPHAATIVQVPVRSQPDSAGRLEQPGRRQT